MSLPSLPAKVAATPRASSAVTVGDPSSDPLSLLALLSELRTRVAEDFAEIDPG